MAAQKIRTSRKNPVLIPGVHRFGRSKMYHKKGIFVKKGVPLKGEEGAKGKKPTFVEKPIGGAQNGGTRQVQVKKSKVYHPTATANLRRHLNRKESGKVAVSTPKQKLRASLKPGTICILVAGRHAGKRVVFLKQLASGLLLITGPFKINSVPLRRVHQQYVIATSTRIDISGITIPGKLDDSYFRRDKKAIQKKRREQKGNIFADVCVDYAPSADRKMDQEALDKEILSVIKSNGDEKKMLLKYLASPFALKSGQYPHQMKF